MYRLSVENLPTGTTVSDLATLFRPFGWVTHVELGAGKGQVELAWGGSLAARDLDGAEYRGRRLAVRNARGTRADEGLAVRIGGDF
jgi:hypothetical protein